MTGSELHETKGAAAAAAGHVLVANGAGAAVYQALNGTVVSVNALADLPAPSGGIITLAANTHYVIGAPITTADKFTVSNNSSLTCNDTNGALLTYSGTGAMFTGTSANFTMYQAHLTAPSGTLFDLTGGFLRMDNCTVDATTKDGTLTDVIGIVINRCSFLNSTDGLEFLGSSTVAILSLSKLRYVTTSATSEFVDLGTIVFSTLEISNVVFTAPVGAIAIKGAAASANITTNKIASVTSCEFDANMTALSGITIDDKRWIFSANSLLADTMPDALVSLTGNATATVLSVGVPTLVAGTWVLERAAQFTTTTGGRATYDGERDLVTPIDVSVVVNPASGTNKSIRAYVALNGAVVTNSGIAVNISAGDPKQISVPWQENLSSTDFIEIFIENETDSTDCTVSDATLRLR